MERFYNSCSCAAIWARERLQLSEDEKSRIQALARDIPSLWHSPQTSAADRKEIVRLLVERVAVHVRADSERAEVEIAWRGGLTTNHGIVRSVSRYESLRDYRQLLPDRAVASGGLDDRPGGQATQPGGISDAAVAQGLYVHLGAEAFVASATKGRASNGAYPEKEGKWWINGVIRLIDGVYPMVAVRVCFRPQVRARSV